MNRVVQSFKSSSSAYHNAFQKFLRHTDQKEKALGWLRNEVERLRCRRVLLDAGAGNGALTEWLSNWFEQVVAIEPNESLCSELRTNCPDATTICAPILGAESRSGDFVLCSHVLYYIPKSDWEANLRQLVDWISPGGVLVVALQNPRTDCMKMVKRFLGGSFDLHKLKDTASRINPDELDVSLETVSATIQTEDLEMACDIAEFVLNVLPMPNPPSWESLKEYVEQYFASNDGYRFSCDQDFLRIARST